MYTRPQLLGPHLFFGVQNRTAQTITSRTFNMSGTVDRKVYGRTPTSQAASEIAERRINCSGTFAAQSEFFPCIPFSIPRERDYDGYHAVSVCGGVYIENALSLAMPHFPIVGQMDSGTITPEPSQSDTANACSAWTAVPMVTGRPYHSTWAATLMLSNPGNRPFLVGVFISNPTSNNVANCEIYVDVSVHVYKQDIFVQGPQ